MKTLREIKREGFIFALQRTASVAEAAQMMETHNIGIVAILEDERPMRGNDPSLARR